MDLQQYVESLRQQVAVAAEAGGQESRAVAERLLAPLDSAIRLTLLEALGVAAEEITTELAPGSVELRLRGRDPEFVVTAPPVEPAGQGSATSPPPSAPIAPPVESEEGGMTRINLRLPDHLKARIERAADEEGLSINAWLVRAATVALERNPGTPPPGPPRVPSGQRYTGWAR
jgi:hypothetical protein